MEGSYNEKKFEVTVTLKSFLLFGHKMLGKLISLVNIMNRVEIYHMDSEPSGNVQLFT